jgi:hypothetical protein
MLALLPRVMRQRANPDLISEQFFSGRHLAAAFRAALTDLGAVAHDAVIREGKAMVGAMLTDLGAGRAGFFNVFRAALHEIRAQAAYLGAINHRHDMVGLNVTAAHGKTMGQCFLAGTRAFHRYVDSLFHVSHFHFKTSLSKFSLPPGRNFP